MAAQYSILIMNWKYSCDDNTSDTPGYTALSDDAWIRKNNSLLAQKWKLGDLTKIYWTKWIMFNDMVVAFNKCWDEQRTVSV